jgi:hypothetical protein
MSLTYEHETSFLCLGMNIFFLHCDFHLLKVLKTLSDVHLIMCALCEKKQLKELMDQKRKNVLFSSIFFFCF